MGLAELKPGNTRRAQATAVNVFNAFVKHEGVEFEYVKSCIKRNTTGKCFISVLDKFGKYLEFNEGRKGKPLAKNTAIQYYRQCKMWFFRLFPAQQHIVQAKLLSMGKTLDNFCMKRDGKVVNKAPPCTKSDLKKMMVYLYKNACTPSDYQDSALLCLLWYLFGRASDLSLIRKPNLSVDAADVLFIRLIHMKTSEEQGLSLFPDADFSTCPLVAMALALVTQSAPCADLLDNLPELSAQASIDLSPSTPLLELLEHPEEFSTLDTPAVTGKDSTPTIYSHVNRILDRVAPAAGVQGSLSSHSFRRGGAQHVNGCVNLTARWIFDRGSWNMSTTNKGFNYIFNTSREDHKVSKALSGHGTADNVQLPDLTSFDARTQETIASVQRLLFTTCYKLEQSRYNVSKRVLDVLTAYLIRHVPLLKEANPDSLAIQRVETCVLRAGSSMAELLAWSSHLAAAPATCQETISTNPDDVQQSRSLEDDKIIQHQRSVIDAFIQHVKRQDERMDTLEAKLNKTATQDKKAKRQHEDIEDSKPTKRRKTSVTHLHATWFAWYAQEPPMRLAPVSK